MSSNSREEENPNILPVLDFTRDPNPSEFDLIDLALDIASVFDDDFSDGFNNEAEMKALSLPATFDSDIFERMILLERLHVMRGFVTNEQYSPFFTRWEYTHAKQRLAADEDLEKWSYQIIFDYEISQIFSHFINLEGNSKDRYSKIERSFNIAKRLTSERHLVEAHDSHEKKVGFYEFLDGILGSMIAPYMLDLGADERNKGALHDELYLLQSEEKLKVIFDGV